MYNFEGIIGKSSAMQKIFSLLEKIIDSDSTVLIEGESGVGKELICKAIHYNSPRKDKPLIIQNCTGLNENLLESELFGHVKGAFTGAIRDKKGLFEIADKGTFFLDEIADMSPALQVKLLRVLQEGTFTKVGGIQPQKVDVRIIAATNKNLENLVERGEFREDLFYRLNVIKLEVPPLRERKEDIPLLIDYFLSKHANGKKIKTLSKGALEILTGYNWPGNVRELENEIEKLVLLSGENEIITEDIISPRITDSSNYFKKKKVKSEGKLKSAIASLEKEMILDSLRKYNWNKSKAAKELGISRVNLINKINEYCLDRRKQRRTKYSVAPLTRDIESASVKLVSSRRNFIRKQISIDTVFWFINKENHKVFCNGMIRNISGGGIFIDNIRCGEYQLFSDMATPNVGINFEIPGYLSQASLNARVVRLDKKNDTSYCLGAEFIGINTDLRDKIVQFTDT